MISNGDPLLLCVRCGAVEPNPAAKPGSGWNEACEACVKTRGTDSEEATVQVTAAALQTIRTLTEQGLRPDAQALPPGAFGALELIRRVCDAALSDLSGGTA